MLMTHTHTYCMWQNQVSIEKCALFGVSCHQLHVCCCYVAAVILEKTIRIPRSLSVKAAQVLKGFLNKVNSYDVTMTSS